MKIFFTKKVSFDGIFLVLTSLFFVLLRFPSLFEPYWYGDESIYQVIGSALNHGRLLYQGIWDNKPPLLYIVYALFHGDQPTIRLVSMVTGLIAIWTFYFLAKRLFINRYTSSAATSMFALLFGLPLLEGNIANAENFMIPLIVGAAWIVIVVIQTPLLKRINSILLLGIAGILLGIAFLFKVVGLFDFVAFFLFIFIEHYHSAKKLYRQALPLIALTVGFSIPFSLSVIYFFQKHILGTYIASAFKNNVGYVNYGNQFIIPQGLLFLKTLLLAGFCIFFFLRRKHMKKATMFIGIWVSFGIYDALFSQRPYTHYLLVIIASFSLFLAYTFFNKKLRFESTFISILLCLFLSMNFWFYIKILPYYTNFFRYVTNHESITTYQSFFDKNTPRDYQLVEFLTSKKQEKETFYLWGNDAQIYSLTNTLPPGRYIVAYHVSGVSEAEKETIQAVKKEQPDLIIIMPGMPPPPFSLTNYQKKLTIGTLLIYEKLF